MHTKPQKKSNRKRAKFNQRIGKILSLWLKLHYIVTNAMATNLMD